MSELETIKKIESIEEEAKLCVEMADATMARLNIVHAMLRDFVADFWGEKEVEARALGADDIPTANEEENNLIAEV